MKFLAATGEARFADYAQTLSEADLSEIADLSYRR